MPRRSLFPYFVLALLVAVAGGLVIDWPPPAGSMPMVIRDAAAPVPPAPTAPTAPRKSAPSVEEPR
jgi:hypothetical protein